MHPAMIVLFILLVSGVGGQATPPLPQCWMQYGECLDSNQPPLDLTNVIKPKVNPNVVAAVPNIFTIQDCLSACENQTDCRYYTLYSNNPKKVCQLVGFNIGNACQRLSNVCILYKACQLFDTKCGMDCPAGRRLIRDRSADWFTLIVGGVADPRTLYQDNIEIVRKDGVSCSVVPQNQAAAEGAAGTYIAATGLLMVCGGFRSGSYLAACQTMSKQGSWVNPAPEALAVARAYHAMVSVGNRAYVFGGFNNNGGMLDSVEMYVAATAGPPATTAVPWTLTSTTLPTKRSHMCAVSLNINATDMIFLMGGWDVTLDYIAEVIKYTVDPATGALTRDNTISVSLPADYAGSPAGRADMACSYYRLRNWRDGILMTGGYRSAGAWLNTVWFLDLVTVATSPAANPWVRFTDISKRFDQGRHYHGLSIALDQAFILGGWSNGPLASTIALSECDTPDLTRKGAWASKANQALKAVREKFVTIGVPRSWLPPSWISTC